MLSIEQHSLLAWYVHHCSSWLGVLHHRDISRWYQIHSWIKAIRRRSACIAVLSFNHSTFLLCLRPCWRISSQMRRHRMSSFSELVSWIACQSWICNPLTSLSFAFFYPLDSALSDQWYSFRSMIQNLCSDCRQVWVAVLCLFLLHHSIAHHRLHYLHRMSWPGKIYLHYRGSNDWYSSSQRS